MKNYGFSLIELLVTIAILLIVAGGAVAGFIGFQERRSVDENAKKLQQIFIAARNKAQVKESPCNSATPLQGYRVRYTAGTGTVTLHPLCGANPVPITDPPTNPTQAAALESYTLVIPSGTANIPNVNGTVIDFYTLQRGTNGSGESIFSLQSGSTTYGFKVQRGPLGGSISNVMQDPS